MTDFAVRDNPPWHLAEKLILALTLLFMVACSSPNVRSMRIDMQRVEARQYLPTEITNMLYDLGYDAYPDSDPARTEQSYDEYRLRFHARDGSDIRIDVHIRLTNKLTGIHFYEKGKQPLSSEAVERYEALKRRVDIQFGADNVRENRPILTP